MKNRKKNTKLVLLLLLVCITLGYAALRTGLNINGTANVSSSSWNVYFSNYQMSNATNITPTEEPVIVGTTTTSISYEVDLVQPGDLYEFSVEVVNGGSLDANISLVSKYNGSEIGPTNPVPEYITYTVTDGNGDPIVDNHRLNHGDREIVKVYVKYRDDDASVLPTQDIPGLCFDIEIEATKAEKEEPVGNYVVSNIETEIGHPIPQGVNVRSTPAQAMADWQYILEEPGAKQPAFLKFELDGNNVSENYVGFEVTDEMAQKNLGMTAGFYYLRGSIDESSSQSKPVFTANVNVIKEAFDYEHHPDRCQTDSSTGMFWCFVFDPNLSVDALPHGAVGATGDSNYSCNATAWETASCTNES